MSQIMVMLESITFGAHYFKTAILLRESMLVSALLFNAEVWYSVTKTQLQQLQEVDTLLLKRVLNCPFSSPGPAIFLELGVMPLAQILMGRRVNYLHYLLSLNKKEMLSQFFWAQWRNPFKHYWTETIKTDLHRLNIDLSLEKISEIKLLLIEL